jgi:hypothetical protein
MLRLFSFNELPLEKIPPFVLSVAVAEPVLPAPVPQAQVSVVEGSKDERL